MPNLLQRPQAQESNSYFKTYIDLVEGDDVLTTLREKKNSTSRFLDNIPNEKWDWAYAPGKWTVKEVLIHLMDTERIMAYRALRFGRKDQTALPGFEQDDYISAAGARQRTVASIIREHQSVREASLSLFENLDASAMQNIGTASNSPFSPLALSYVIAGHEIHHLNVIREKYLSEAI